MRHIHCFGLALLTLGACSDPAAPPAPAAFERPESVSFFCWNTAEGRVEPLANCAPAEGEAAMDVVPGSPPEPLELHAVVTQTATGEVAALQVTGDDDQPAGPIDSDVRVPGFTFAPVGDVPSAVVTPPSDPGYTYVVSRGSSSLHVVETASFRSIDGAIVREKERMGAEEPLAFFALGDMEEDGFGRPSGMVLSPSGDELIVAVPEAGEVWFIPLLGGGEVGDPVRVPLASTVPAAVDLTALPADQLPPTYRVLCPDGGALDPAPVPPRDPVSLGPTARPWALVVDEESGRVLVSDRALPIIHVVELETHTELPAINVGVPTRSLVLTPRVPARAGDTERTERFLYAIDDDSQSVLAVDYSDPARASFGAVLTVGPDAPQDRLALPSAARAVEVVTPTWTTEGPLPECSAETAAPENLRGVFLTVATSNGFVRVFDIYDLDAPCRGPEVCGGEDTGNDDLVAIARHRPRIGLDVEDPVGLEPPEWDIGGLSATVDAETGVADGLVSTLEPITCPAGLAPVFGLDEGEPDEADDTARICAVTEPWAATSQRYLVTWEGALPFTTMTGANFTPGEATLDVRFDPCALGVLGDGQTVAGEPYAGDVIAITSPLPPSLSDEARGDCERLFEASSSGEFDPVRIPIVRASAESDRPTYIGRLELADASVTGVPLDAIRACFPELVEIEVRAQGAFVVESTRAGFRHPVVADADGACVVDPALAAAGQNGRAISNTLFATPEIAFELGGMTGAEEAQLELVTTDAPSQLVYNITPRPDSQSPPVPSLLSELEYNEVDERLYVIDSATRGVVRVNLLEGGAVDGTFR